MNAAADGAAMRTPDENLVRYAHLIYGLHACAVLTGILTSSSIAGRFLFGLPSIVAVILNYARRHEARGTWLESHFEWQIHTFWYALLWIAVTLVVSAPFLLVVVGVFMAIAGFAIVGLWVVYRVVRGWFALRERRPMPRHPAVAPATGG